MTALEDLAAPKSRSVRLVDRVARGLASRFTRRSFLAQTAVVGSAMVVDPKGYILTPGTAYASVCGPGATASSGWTVFCCTVNGGKNACPPGTFTAGWWKAADSSWCCGGYRYIVDCNATCKSCTSGCAGDHICDKRCWNCSCGTGSKKTCDQRRHCCNAFRYGQCNTHVRCSGGVACRVVSCVAPYKWDNCTTTSLSDNRTAEHNAPCLQGCGPILRTYDALGAQGSPLGSSLGPERAVGDGRGRFVRYQHGSIHWTKTTGARAVYGASYTIWTKAGGPGGSLGYPKGGRGTAKDGKGWYQQFEHGAVCDSAATTTHSVSGPSYTVWVARGRETGTLGYPAGERVFSADRKSWYQRFQHGAVCDSPATRSTSVTGTAFTVWAAQGRERGYLGYPTGERVFSADRKSWYQQFQRGAVCDSPATTTTSVSGPAFRVWAAHGREKGALGYPTRERAFTADRKSWYQQFQHGAVCDSPATVSSAVTGAVYTRWSALDRQHGRLGYPRRDAVEDRRKRGRGQAFTGGQLWSLDGKAALLVTGRVLKAWLDDGGADGRWGYPLTDVTTTADGTQVATFEGGVLRA
ncbi:MAG TPA: hypothetical protein VKB14_09025 [Actinomycetales bacterium]|nr:hypothetical protein [Actinomycetales bacterium]